MEDSQNIKSQNDFTDKDNKFVLKLVARFILFFGAAWFLFGFYELFETLHYKKIGVTTNGVIVKKYTDEGAWRYYALFKVNETEYEATNKFSSFTDDDLFKIGDSVEIIYNPKNPERCRFNTDHDMQLPSIMCFSVGLAIAAFIFIGYKNKQLDPVFYQDISRLFKQRTQNHVL